MNQNRSLTLIIVIIRFTDNFLPIQLLVLELERGHWNIFLGPSFPLYHFMPHHAPQPQTQSTSLPYRVLQKISAVQFRKTPAFLSVFFTSCLQCTTSLPLLIECCTV